MNRYIKKKPVKIMYFKDDILYIKTCVPYDTLIITDEKYQQRTNVYKPNTVSRINISSMYIDTTEMLLKRPVTS